MKAKNRKILFFMKIWQRNSFAMMLCFCLAVLTSCGKREESANSFTVGAVLPLTGAGSAAGTYVKDSLVFATTLAEVADARTSPLVRVVFADSKSNPRDAISAYRQVLSLNPGIEILFVQMSSIASALAPIAKEDGIVMVSISSTEGPIASNPYFIVNYLDAATQARLYLSHMDLGVPITIYYLNDEYGRSVEAAIRELATDRRVSSHPYLLDSSARDIVAPSLPNSGEVVIIGYGSKMAELARELDIHDFKGEILCSAELLIASNLDIIRSIKVPVWVVQMDSLPVNILDSFRSQLGREATGADVLALNGMLLVMELYKSAPHNQNPKAPLALLRRMEEIAATGIAPGISQLVNQRLIYKASLSRVN